MSVPADTPPSGRQLTRGPAGVATMAIQAVTALGAVAGVQGFLSGAFEPLVDQLHDAVPLVDGPVLPAIALGAVVGLTHIGALTLALRRDPRAAAAGVAAGGVLLGWVTVQLPLIGWTSPVQWAFLAIGAAEVATAGIWLGRTRRGR